MMNNNFRLVDHLKSMLLVSILLMSFSFASAQTKTISGTVTGGGVPLPAVSVSIKGKALGTVSDFDGLYSLEVDQGDVLVFSYIGFTTEEITVGESSKVDVDLQENVDDLEEVIVVGYQKQKKSELTGAISSIKGEELEKQAVGNFAEALQGQIAGVNIQASSGAPGAKINVQIRGANSLRDDENLESNPAAGISNPLLNSTGPLWVVDGVPLQRDPNLSPNEIQSVEVLKDAASTAIYGVRASAGVILVTTKRGKKGGTTVELNTYTSVRKITSKVPVLNTSESILVNFNFVQNNINLGDFAASGIFARNPRAAEFDTDWQDLVQNDNALAFNANARFSGGTENINYNLSLDYLDEEGVFINSSLERTNLRLNTTFRKNKFSVFTNVNLSNSNILLEPWRLLYGAISTQSFEPNPRGRSQISASRDTSNRLIQGNLFSALQQRSERNQFSAGAYASIAYDWFEGFRTKLNLNANTFQIGDRLFEPELTFVDSETGIISNSRPSRFRVRDGIGKNGSVEFITEYNKKFGNHNLSLLAGYTRESKNWTQRTVDVAGGFPDRVFPTLNRSAESREARASELLTPNKLVSYLGTFGYNYKGKYLLRANLRRDGSSNFLPSRQFSNFWGVSAGWDISKEGFFDNSDALSFISQLKFRGSFGKVGNQNIPAFATLAPVVVGSNVVLPDDSIGNGRIASALGNELLTWEKSETTNYGLDLELFGGAFNFTGEIYKVRKDDLLFEANLPLSVGVNPDGNNPAKLFSNIGELTNEGVELSFGYRDVKGDFKWGVNATYTQNENKVTRLVSSASEIQGGPVTPGDNTIATGPVTFGRVGESIGSFYLLKTDGIINNEEELAEYKTLGGETQTAIVGDLKYVDSDGDGTINLDQDRVLMGNGVPDYEVGLSYNMSYKNFDFTMQWFASVGAKVYNGPKALAYGAGTHRDLLYSFNPGTNENVNIPINRGDERALNYSPFSDLFLEDGDYIRLRNIQLGYSLPKKAIESVGLSKFRIYLAASNVLTITDYTGFDPEVGGGGLLSRGIDRGFTPVTGSARIGLQLTF